MASVVHRAGPLKQKNKSHSGGKHRTKGQIRRESNGKTGTIATSRAQKTALGRQERRNQAFQLRQHSRTRMLEQKRSLGCSPSLTALIPLSNNNNISNLLSLLGSSTSIEALVTNDLKVTHFSVPKFKKRLSLITPDPHDLHAVLDSMKVADTAVFLLSADEPFLDANTEELLSSLLAQGLPTSFLAVQGLNKLPWKKQSEMKKGIQKSIHKWFPDEKLHMLDSDSDVQVLLRLLSDHKIKRVHWREMRPYLLAESVKMDVNPDNPAVGTLAVSGYIRGQALSVNKLVHLPGWGDFQLKQIDAPKDPYPLHDGKPHRKTMEVDEDEEGPRVLERANATLQESLQSEVVPDPMEGEQTWPTEEELRQAEEERHPLKRVPRGTSNYQATWISDPSDEEEGMEEDSEEEQAEEDEEIQEHQTVTASEIGDEQYDAKMDLGEEEATLAKLKEAKQHTMFPDEIDTPKDVSARQRFQKYRGLKSFRTSPWDPKENLPLDYARIFQFKNFMQTKKKAMLQAQEEEGAMPGWFVTIHVANVPTAYMANYSAGRPLVVFGLLNHEQKISVCHYMLHRQPKKEKEMDRDPIKSNEPMIFHVGFRRFEASPIYSQHTLGSKHKFERFLPDGVSVASVYAPVMFPPAPVLMFEPRSKGLPKLVSVGSVMAVNPDRMVIKRIVLSGYPISIKKRLAVIRYMFFNPEDIKYFKPICLRTKYGRNGHIKEAIGTHGHMKCVFDQQLKSQDTVLMNLYKRVFPRFTYNHQLMC